MVFPTANLHAVNTQSPTPRRAAFSLIEMMITMALLGFIVVGLTAMFVQTQRAFRGGMAQTDVLESGRAVTELLARELEQASPAYLTNVNFYSLPVAYNAQYLPGVSPSRTNVLGKLFFLTHNNLSWTGVGYVVAPLTDGVGTLYRYETNLSGSLVNSMTGFLSVNTTAPETDSLLHRVADGIVHLRVQAYTTEGYWLQNENINGIFAAPVNQSTAYAFTSNAVPAYVELELGVLENAALKKLQALPPLPSTARADYLKREQTAGRVHIFRRHIAVRNVDPEAYR